MTIHQSKGLEFEVVIVIDAMHTLMNSLPQPHDRESHLKLMYVAATRARDTLLFALDSDAPINQALVPGIK